jgi:DNA-binding LacI/PurR family transcriptional regulator
VTSNERTTMAKIAERSGVSLSTVSLALRDRPGVGPDTRQRVLEVARNLGYIPQKRAFPYTPALTNIGLILKADPGRVPQTNRFYSHVDKLGMGRLALQMLVNRIEHPESSPVRSVVDPRLLERESVRAI